MLENPINVVFFCIISALFLGFGTYFFVELWRVAKSLTHATRELEKDGHLGRMTVFPTRPKHLMALWRQFLTDRDRTTREYQEMSLSTLAPEEFFTEEAILPTYNRHFSVVMAGVFTALGILGTFWGLVSGLEGVQVQNPAQMMQGVSGLLEGMSAAFYTSIFGIVASLLWLMSDRTLYNRVLRATDQFLVAAHFRFPVESADRLLHRLLEVEEGESEAIKAARDLSAEHLAFAKQQTGILQSLSFDLASKLSNTMSEAITDAIGPTLQNLSNQMKEMSITFGDQQVAALDRIVDTFQENLSSEMKGQFENLASTLEKTAEWQAVVHEELGALMDRVERAAEAQARALDEQTKVHEAFAETADRVGLITESAGKAVQDIHDAAVKTADQLREVSSLTDEHISALSRAASDLVEKNTLLDKSLNVYTGANRELREQLAAQIDAIRAQVTEMTEFWEAFHEDLDGMGSKLTKGILEFRATTEDRFKEIFQIFDSELATVVSHLGGTLADMRDVSENLSQGILQLEQVLGSGTAAFQDATTSLASLPRMEAPLTEVRGALDHYKDLPTSLEQLSRGLGEVRTELRSILQRADGDGRRRLEAPLPVPTDSEGPSAPEGSTVVTPQS